jgi:arylsulfatase A-like enzyme
MIRAMAKLSCHGNPLLSTPNLDKLHSRSLRLTGYHAAPMCTPTWGQLMTGMDAARNGALKVSSGRALLNTHYQTMGDFFARNGYQTGMFGKRHLGYNYPYRPEDRGFRETLWFPSSCIGSIPDYLGNDYFDDTYLKNGARQAVSGYRTDLFFEQAIMAASAKS